VRAASLEPEFARPEPAKRFVLVSDLLEHDPEAGFSAYAEGASFERYQARFPGAPTPALSAAAVRVVALDRASMAERQTAARDLLWAPLFDAAEVGSVSFEGL